jgi:stearoyl-CoA desaturase (Delta-9 desaturase)
VDHLNDDPSQAVVPLLVSRGGAVPAEKLMGPSAIGGGKEYSVAWLRTLPFAAVHVMALGVFWVGWSWPAVAIALALFWARMFAITGFYHRYLSHRSYKTSRWFQFVFAVLGNMAAQKGPLWWAAHHRHHHRYSDQERDLHSPRWKGFLYSHVGWFFAPVNFRANRALIPDLAKYRELRLLDEFDFVAPTLLGAATFGLGCMVDWMRPELGTSGIQMLIWGFFVSTVFLAHSTFTINSLSHLFGGRRFETGDTSRNNPVLALLTLGEGWHNNHHHYAKSARQGFYWWEVDLTFYGLLLLAKLGLIWDLKPVPVHILATGRKSAATAA